MIIFILTLLILASGCIQQETPSRAQNNEEMAGRVISEKLVVKFGFFPGFRRNQGKSG